MKAGLTPPGTKGIDISVSAPVAFDVQVKTATGPRWSVAGKNGVQTSPDLWFVLVQWDRDRGCVARTLVMRSSAVKTIAHGLDDDWRKRVGPKPKARGYMIVERAFAGAEPVDLSPYEEEWGTLPSAGVKGIEA